MLYGFRQVARSTPFGRDVQQPVGDGGRAIAETRVAGHDHDPGHRLAIEVADGDRRDGHQHGQAHEHDGRRQEERPADAIAVLAPGDDRGIREERVAIGHQATPPAWSDGVAASGASVADSSAGRPTCSMNSASRLGSTTSKRVTDRPRARTAARTAAGSAPGDSSSSLPTGDGTEPVDPGQLGQPGRRHVTVDRQPQRATTAGPLQVADPAAGHQPAVVDDGDRFAHRLGRLHLVGREDERPAAVAELHERLAQEDEVDRVEPGERLVHQQHVRSVQHRRDELDLLLVPLRKLLGPPIRVLGDPEAGQPGERLALRAVGGVAVQRRVVDELVEDVHPRVQAALLGQIAPRPPRQLADRPTVPADLAGVGPDDAEADPHRGRLAGTVGAEEAEDLARRRPRTPARRGRRSRRSAS